MNLLGLALNIIGTFVLFKYAGLGVAIGVGLVSSGLLLYMESDRRRLSPGNSE